MTSNRRFFLTAFVFIGGLASCFDNKQVETQNNNQDSLMNVPPPPEPHFVTGISQDSLISFLLKTKEVNVNKDANSPFDDLKYNKVIAYEYQGVSGEHLLGIVDKGELANTIKRQKGLNQIQVNNLTKFLGANSTYGNTKAFCFAPHLGIVFFMDKKIVLNISISLECNFLRSSIPIPATNAQQIEISEGDTYPAEGFSENGRKKIISLFSELKIGEF